MKYPLVIFYDDSRSNGSVVVHKVDCGTLSKSNLEKDPRFTFIPNIGTVSIITAIPVRYCLRCKPKGLNK